MSRIDLKVSIMRVTGCLVVLVALLWSGVCAAQITNPGFESTYAGLPYPRPLPSNWSRVDDPSFNSYCTESWYTEGAVSACLFSLRGASFEPGQYQSFYQFVDLTGMGTLAFDAMLTGNPSEEFSHFEASVLVDDVPIWTATDAGEYLGQEVDISGVSADWHMVELRITALESGTFDNSYLAYWDNMMLLEGPSTIEATIALDPGILNLRTCGRWITCYIELPEGYDVAQIDESTVTLEQIAAATGADRWARCWARWWWGRPWGHRWAHADRTPRNIVDHDRDGIRERVIRFDRDKVEAVVQAPETTLAVAGQLLDGTPFEGTATIKVIENRPCWNWRR
ncbi:MAG: hypothetical protein ABFE01_04980 [Phycisphaerales bacterium]|jgi:hypothetical protein